MFGVCDQTQSTTHCHRLKKQCPLLRLEIYHFLGFCTRATYLAAVAELSPGVYMTISCETYESVLTTGLRFVMKRHPESLVCKCNVFFCNVKCAQTTKNIFYPTLDISASHGRALTTEKKKK